MCLATPEDLLVHRDFREVVGLGVQLIGEQLLFLEVELVAVHGHRVVALEPVQGGVVPDADRYHVSGRCGGLRPL